MDTIYYINKITVGSVDKDFFEEYMQDKVVANLEDLTDDTILILNEEQTIFFQKYADLLIDDPISTYYMKTPSDDILNEEVRRKREAEYKSTTDSLYMAYIKYKEFGKEEEATAAYNKWKQAVLEVGEANPYITE